MARERLTRIFEAFVDGDEPREALNRLCRACVTELGVTEVGLALLVGNEHRGTLGVSHERVLDIEALQFTLGEGPCIDAHSGGQVVLEPRLAGSNRWLVYGPEAVAAGVRAVFALPLQLGAARFGALDLYRQSPGDLGEGVLADAMVVAELATAMVMRVLAQAPPGSVPELLDEPALQRTAVHQAAGMVSIQLDVSLEEALIALRARAYSEDRSVEDVAHEVVARRTRFER